MTLNQLLYLREICDEKNMTRAAEKLHISQSTLSMAVRKLEQELGVPLFNHIGRTLEPTEYGIIMYENAVKILADVDKLADTIDTLRRSRDANHVRIGSDCQDFMGLLMGKLSERGDNSIVEEVRVRYVDAQKKILANEIDAFIGEMPIENSLLTSIRVYEDEYHLYGSAETAARYESVEKLSTILSENKLCALTSGNSGRELLDTVLKSMEINPAVEEFHESESIGFAIHRGKGVGFIPQPVFEEHTSKYFNNIKELKTDVIPHRTIYIVAGKKTDKKTRKFIAEIRNTL